MTYKAGANLPGDGRPLGYATAEAEGHDDMVYDKCAARTIGLPHHNLILAVVEELYVLSFAVCPDVELHRLRVILEPIGKLSDATFMSAVYSEDNERPTF